MRVTQSMLANNSLRHLSSAYNRMGALQEQLNTGKRINRPSDDPVGAMKSITYRTDVTQVGQFKRNFTEAHSWIDNSDAALDQATKAMERIYELTVRASNGTFEEGQLDAIATEIDEIKKQLVDIANTKVGDKYIFNGTATDQPRVDSTSSTTQNNDPVKIELSKGIEVQVNVTNKDLFSDEFFKEIDDLVSAIKSEGDIGGYIGKMQDLTKTVVSERASLGARANRMDLMENRVNQQEEISKKMQSDNEDVEYEQVITQLVIEESLLRANLSVSARIVQPSLADFLR